MRNNNIVKLDLQMFSNKENDLDSCTFQVKDSFIHRKVAGNDILISIGNNIANFNGYITLNESASFLWKMMKEPCSLNQLILSLENKFSISHEIATKDVISFLEELKEQDMVVKILNEDSQRNT